MSTINITDVLTQLNPIGTIAVGKTLTTGWTKSNGIWYQCNTPVVVTSGGTLTSDTNYFYYTFTATGSLVIGTAGFADVLLVGGGGASGTGQSSWWGAGGGGGGGVTWVTGFYLSVGTSTVTVGAGGTVPGVQQNGNPGGYSSLLNLYANGGLGGTHSGGSGVGSTGGNAGTNILSTTSYPYPIYTGCTNTGTGSPGRYDGGAGAGAGANAVTNVTTGGAGYLAFNGNYYGGGGGGGYYNYPSAGGVGGGGYGLSNGNGVPGTANTGGGGGGCYAAGAGSAGGSGVVIIRVAR